MHQNFYPGFSLCWFVMVLMLIAGFAACTEEIGLYTDSEPVPIVYCLLDPADSVQYVRIGRSYQAGSNGFSESPEPDSVVWNIQHEVYIEEYADEIRGSTYEFQPDNNISKDSGFFPVTGLRVYSSSFRPVPGYSYRLYVYFPDLDKMVSARMTVHDLPEIMDPLPLSIRKINFEPGQSYVIRWYPGLNTGVYEMVFRIHYRDSTAVGEEFKTADYRSGGIFDLQTSQLQEYGMGGPSFFASMAKEIRVVPGIIREVISVEFIMVSGGTDLGFHFRSGMENGSIFTNLADYTNLRNGIGIFSSRSELHVPNLTLSEVTIDLLAQDEKTRALGFKDSKGH